MHQHKAAGNKVAQRAVQHCVLRQFVPGVDGLGRQVGHPGQGCWALFRDHAACNQLLRVKVAGKAVAKRQVQLRLRGALGWHPRSLGQMQVGGKLVRVDQALAGYGVALAGVVAACTQPKGRERGGVAGATFEQDLGAGIGGVDFNGEQSKRSLGSNGAE